MPGTPAAEASQSEDSDEVFVSPQEAAEESTHADSTPTGVRKSVRKRKSIDPGVEIKKPPTSVIKKSRAGSVTVPIESPTMSSSGNNSNKSTRTTAAAAVQPPGSVGVGVPPPAAGWTDVMKAMLGGMERSLIHI